MYNKICNLCLLKIVYVIFLFLKKILFDVFVFFFLYYKVINKYFLIIVFVDKVKLNIYDNFGFEFSWFEMKY